MFLKLFKDHLQFQDIYRANIPGFNIKVTQNNISEKTVKTYDILCLRRKYEISLVNIINSYELLPQSNVAYGLYDKYKMQIGL